MQHSEKSKLLCKKCKKFHNNKNYFVTIANMWTKYDEKQKTICKTTYKEGETPPKKKDPWNVSQRIVIQWAIDGDSSKDSVK